jgi:hypothetical protein
MASRAEARIQLMEYGQLFVAAFTIVFCTVWVAVEMPRVMDTLYGDQGIDVGAFGIQKFRWLGLFALPVYIAIIYWLKRKQASRAIVIVTAYLFAVASLLWVWVAFWTITVPLTPIGRSV